MFRLCFLFSFPYSVSLQKLLFFSFPKNYKDKHWKFKTCKNKTDFAKRIAASNDYVTTWTTWKGNKKLHNDWRKTTWENKERPWTTQQSTKQIYRCDFNAPNPNSMTTRKKKLDYMNIHGKPLYNNFKNCWSYLREQQQHPKEILNAVNYQDTFDNFRITECIFNEFLMHFYE